MTDYVYLAMGGKLAVRIENIAGVMLVRCRSHNVEPTVRLDLLPDDARRLATMLNDAAAQADGIAAAYALTEIQND